MRTYRSGIKLGSLLALLVWSTVSESDAIENRQSRPAQRHLDPSGFPWPNGAEMALSLTFDDGRPTQVTHAIPLLDAFDVKATFYSQPENLRNELAGWRRAVAVGHEIGNHTVGHPCTGNFAWVRYDGVVLESYDLERMRAEIVQANDEIEEMLGVRPVSFAYPCGQTYVGRGRDTRSYVPLVAELFQTGRRWLDETSNAPDHFDTAQVMAMRMDGEDFAAVQRMVERARHSGNWLVLAGHGVGDNPRWGTQLDMLKDLLAYAQNPDNRVWIAPVTEVATFIADQQAARK
jgi:peptidoglycan/xylan/chitin deacetylase (PgdA/CDA1 family)